MSRARDLADGTFSGAFSADSPTLVVDDTNNRVGVGTASPYTQLEISSTDPIVRFNDSNGGTDTKNFELRYVGTNSPDVDGLYFRTVNDANTVYSDKLAILGDGNVGIGTASPEAKVHIYESDVRAPAADADDLVIEKTGDTGLSILSTTTGRIYFGDAAGDDQGSIRYVHSDDSMRFENGSSEAARFDGSRNLLIGKTATASVASDTPGHTLYSSGTARHIVSGGEVMNIIRQTNEGTLIGLYKDATNVGAIGTGSGKIYIGTYDGSDAFLKFESNIVSPSSSVGGIRDNVIDLGKSNSRFDDIFATNGTINTSDANEKQDVAELDEAEKRVATAAKGLIRKFRWISSVEEKGDDARIHVGVIAQDLQAAFEAEGLDPGRYAMFISTTWWEADETYTDDDGVEQTRTNTYDTAEQAPEGAVERTRRGVRYNQLLAFIIGAM
jgi:hypothetical protein